MFYYGNDRVYKDNCTDQNFLSNCPDLFNAHTYGFSLSIVHTYIYIYMELICDLNRSGTLISMIKTRYARSGSADPRARGTVINEYSSYAIYSSDLI